MLPLPWLLSATACTLGFSPITDASDTDDTDPADTDVEVETDPAETGDTASDDSDTEDTVLPAGSDPMIVEVCDGDDGPWKFVELYNPGDSAMSLAGWTLQRFSNGASVAGISLPLSAITIPARTTWVVGYGKSQSAFTSRFEKSAQTWSDVVDGNGDDAYVLAEGPDVRDVFGIIGQKGNGVAWFYGDTCAKRKPAITTARAVWTAAEWDVDVEPNPFNRD